MDRVELVRRLKRKLVEAGAPKVHVRGGRGTDWGWIEVSGSGKYGEFTGVERQAVQKVCGSSPGLNYWVGEIGDVERILGKELG